MDLVLRVIIACSLYRKVAGDYDGRWPTQVASSTGLCRYGNRIDCCWGWARQSWGHCTPFYYVLRQRLASVRCRTQAVCQPPCKHGDCVGPNKCKCHAGYTGKTCNQDERLLTIQPEWYHDVPVFYPVDVPVTGYPPEDLNECGLKPRPCKYRCMNTFGSYKCYCLNGYMLMPDGSCSNAHTCSLANCQYGCDIVKGEVRCRCPSPGLQLGPDGRTCADVDECATGKAVCPRFRKCVNTFGSYICKCYPGYDLIHAHGKYQCFDIDECYTGQYQCSNFARCFNTPGSYRCKCNDGYRGNGADCTPIPRVVIDPLGPHNFLPGKDNVRNIVRGNGSTLSGSEGSSNRIPDYGGRHPKWPPSPSITAKPQPKTTTTRSPPVTRPVPNPITRQPQKPATRPPQPATRPPQPATRPSQPVTRPPQPATRPPQPATRPPQPATRPPQILTRPPQPVTRPPQPVTRPPPKPTTTTVIYTTAPTQPPTRPPEDNKIQDQGKQRGDVFIPHHENNIFYHFDVERGLSADENEENDDPGVLIHSCNFDNGLCGWIRDKDNDLHWELVKDASGGQYLTVMQPKGKSGKVARLVLPLGHQSPEDLCLSFRHFMSGENSGKLQVFVRRSGAHGPSIWGRNGSHGWGETHITLPGSGIKSIIFKAERGRDRTGQLGLDDVSLKRGQCTKA
ncbi:PREDICTED: nephronectin isoform X1 [Nanorana parkeri]|uniref:nephronectin isoform X1 n=1 Tax=Nanorana parkeri TaxID=125878 RepID=UPI0008540776|nr:PREDICTED: nephronectin isoform X1 [Nanorana parkeri]XP_018409992.1 PREDICTED: nephronectin isoform X1 [Nanorana parkeri]